jgi:hypothetical protein
MPSLGSMDRVVIELPAGRVEIESRPGYLYVIESGELRSLAELRKYTRELERLIEQTRIKRAVIDAREERGDPPPEVVKAMWEWLLTPEHGFEAVAFVLSNEMAVARVNMTALAQKAPIRAFDNVHQAQRWLTRSGKSTMPPPSKLDEE